MNPLQRLRTRWFPRHAARIPARTAPTLLRETEGATPFAESGWKSLAALPGATGMDVLAQQRAVETLWLTHPLVGQIVELLADFTIGEGATVAARDPLVQEALDALLAAQPEWGALQRGVAIHLAVYGEVFLRVHPAGPQGISQLQLIPPTAITAVCHDAAGAFCGAVYESTQLRAVDPVELRRNPALARSLVRTLRTSEFLGVEELVYVRAQAGAPGERGLPELARIVPWVERYDQWLLDRLRINKSRGAFAFLRKVPSWGIDSAHSQASAATGNAVVPRPGSVLVVNDQESWEVLAPQVGADDASADGRALKLMILAGAGIAEHYVGDLAQSNLATAQAAELPMLKRFEAQQRRVIAALQAALTLSLRSLGITGTFEVTLPAPGLTDTLRLTQTLQLQLELGLISRRTARSLVPWITNVAEEEARIAQEIAANSVPGGTP